ncbi:uncharacterized protein B0H64DRAFT_379090 [Chaetomium fimeti]|uniref:Uncharacterized protein n=1 Tax=Chaetomium fimeti TaxID=1854472 RepID=A0AAE0HNH0_9PEZI|nr:hypothetical protein B0H64DRAFT_379090 [Chaetomium fimeti]
MQHPPDDGRARGAGDQIELQPPSMDRGRSSIPRGRGAKKRATLPSHSHSHSYSSHQTLPFSDTVAPSTPEPSNIPPPNRVPSTAPQRGGRLGARQANNTPTSYRASSPATDRADRADRPVRSSTFPSFSFDVESPPAAGSIMAAHGPARKRSRTFEASYEGAADDEGHSKGGHSLRKRARIDYTQEMIDDDLGLPTAKNDLVVKPAATPGARTRKRKGGHDDSGDESEDVASNPSKRHRIDKSPVPPRMPLARRRNPSKKLSADLTPYVDQPSDNEVQDTILVSVPNTGPTPLSEASENSSLQDPESRPSSSGESDAARVQVQPPTPPAQPSQPIEDAMSIVAEGDEAIEDAIVPDHSYDQPQPQLSPTPLSLVTGREAEKAEPTTENEAIKSDDFESAVMQDRETALPEPLDGQINEAGREEQSSPQQSPKRDGTSPEASTTKLEIPKLGQVLALTSRVTSAAPQASQAVAPALPVSLPALLLGSKPTGPARVKALEPIYGAEVPFASHLKLTPYEKEDIPLPGPYTEWVHPVQTVKGEPTPLATPTPVPSPLERKPTGTEWNPNRPLKYSEFIVLYSKETKRRQEKGEKPISMRAFNNECARRYKSAHAQTSASPTSISTPESTASSTVVARTPTLMTTASVEEPALRDSQPVESRPPTAAPSPAPVDDAMGQDDVPEDEQDADEPMDDQVKADSPGEPVEVTRNPHTQYLFPKIRDSNDFAEAFEGWQGFSNERLYETVAAAVETLHTYQQEYNELKKLLDDEDNAKRRRAHDKTVINWENRQKADEPLPPRRHFDDPVKGPAPFEVRGIRAPRPYVDDPLLEQQKEEDRVMAHAYGFKLNTHPTQVGRQNPEEQRWEMPENRLRKRTEKGAELAEENVVEGKRTRKPRHVSDQSQDPSRAGTPTGIAVFGPGRRQRRKPAAATGDDLDGLEQGHFAESFSESPRKGRAARARAAVLLDERDQIAPGAGADGNRTEDEERDAEKPKATRRRGRGALSVPEPPTSVPVGFGGEAGKPKRARNGKGLQPSHQAGGEMVSSSFYSNASTQPDSRPSTSSSNGTAHTAETTESTYSLREKRKRNFALENDPELETRAQRRNRGAAVQKPNGAATVPKKRGPRKKEPVAQAPPPPASVPSPSPRPASPPPLQPPVATKFYHNFVTGPMVVDAGNGSQPAATQAGPYMHTFNAAPAFVAGTHPPPPPPPLVKKPITKIKLTNHGASSSAPSRASTPSNGASGAKPKRPRGKKAAAANEAQLGAAANGDGDLDKPYAEMTKSEKMSWSMRRRWASGEMQGAVEKRRTTLANKKAEKAAGNPNADGSDPNGMGQMTDSGSAGPSDPTTPASMHGQPGSGLLALPQGPPMMLQHPQPHPGFLQQPSYLYAMPHGPPPPGPPPGPMP